ncbi:MAG TPA: flavin monoamine oxidase family protein [Solirubrobacteraceae bacterium]|nr:flavin monoamine oxidase family protein [Solirubrobacteraceae bacterium]
MADVDLVVVGAGLAGLAAARFAAARGRSVVVLEARDRVGGRTLNESLAPEFPGAVVEVGGQWVGPTQTRLLELAAELGVETFPTYARGDNVIEWDGRLRRYRGTIPKVGPAALADVGLAMARLNRMARRIDPVAPWLSADARELDSQTFATWLSRGGCRTRGGRTILEITIQAVFACEPADLSLLHVLFYIRSAGSLEALTDTEGGAQELRFVGGSQRVAERMAEELGPSVVRLASPVRSIAWSADGVEVEGLRARRCVVAVPPTLAGRIAYAPALPGLRDQLTQRMPQGTVWKCMAVYEEPFWRAEGLSGWGLSDAGPVRLTYDNSPPGDGGPGVLLGFLEGDHARRAGLMSAAARRAAVLGTFGRLFGERALAPMRFIEQSWAEEEWTRGCYGASMPPGAWTSFGPALRAPIGPLHWAGAETATVWSGYMDGAVRSGERAAEEALAA